uniref:p53 and DNA damage-regulated protein 1 n=1 Tax=Myxine glutinosa TaxID=7769 RepID=UPI00358E18BF
MARGPEEVFNYLTEVEELAEDVLADRQQVIDLGQKINFNREAIRSLQKEKSKDKVWVCFGSTLIKLTNPQTLDMLQKDQEQLNKEIDKIRSQLKVKVNNLNDAQGKPELKGFDLIPLMKMEMSSIHQCLNR